MAVVPFSNCTVPGADGLTVAVRVTDVPDGCGLAGEALSVVVVAIGVDPTQALVVSQVVLSLVLPVPMVGPPGCGTPLVVSVAQSAGSPQWEMLALMYATACW